MIMDFYPKFPYCLSEKATLADLYNGMWFMLTDKKYLFMCCSTTYRYAPNVENATMEALCFSKNCVSISHFHEHPVDVVLGGLGITPAGYPKDTPVVLVSVRSVKVYLKECPVTTKGIV